MTLLGLGETHRDFSLKVQHEREARAGAGILQFVGLIAFMPTFLSGDFCDHVNLSNRA